MWGGRDGIVGGVPSLRPVALELPMTPCGCGKGGTGSSLRSVGLPVSPGGGGAGAGGAFDSFGSMAIRRAIRNCCVAIRIPPYLHTIYTHTHTNFV